MWTHKCTQSVLTPATVTRGAFDFLLSSFVCDVQFGAVGPVAAAQMDSPFGGRPLTRTSDVRHVSVSPSSRSGYRSGSRSCSPSSYRSSDSGHNAATRRPSRSPVRHRNTQEEAYFAYQAARIHHRNNAILADDSPYIPPSNRLPPLPKDVQETNGRSDVGKRRAPVIEQHFNEVHRPVSHSTPHSSFR